ncbi:Transcriptional regulator PadR [Ktedonobacter racemifer DSM 44963]|uniref:Transcriptional regulator PadR n=1 Tax=Ktedonobacter racemifer DSM 44963 TaxID=485913 RepID=D6TW84_KTERA|nr:Transcriptional regulator PadR [Ktedonobacter racemifer DSM 44963]
MQVRRESRDLWRKRLSLFTAKIVTDPLPEFTRRQKPSRFDNRSLSVNPLWLNAVQPGAFYGQPARNDAHVPHSPLIQVFFASILSNAEVIQLLEQQHTAHSERLASYQQLVRFPLDALVGAPGVSRRQMLRRLTLEQGVKREQAYIDWLEEAIEVVRRLPE